MQPADSTYIQCIYILVTWFFSLLHHDTAIGHGAVRVMTMATDRGLPGEGTADADWGSFAG
jgi:hypothetical protein